MGALPFADEDMAIGVQDNDADADVGAGVGCGVARLGHRSIIGEDDKKVSSCGI